jgi:hypothetical protein
MHSEFELDRQIFSEGLEEEELMELDEETEEETEDDDEDEEEAEEEGL